MLDDDQAVVGLMALDIHHGQRWPIFFDGQRYMGAIEAYVAAGFECLFGTGPTVVALAPTLFFGLFVALQYAVWRSWAGRTTGHLAALIAAVGAPMPALWSVVPRGGYVAVLAWAVASLWAYRVMTRPGPDPPRVWQAAWGFWLMFGYFVNPQSVVVYATLALDWSLGRHGRDLRHERHLAGGWVDRRGAGFVWLGLAAGTILALAVCGHVQPRWASGRIWYVFALDRLPPIVGVVGVIVVLVGVGVWSGFLGRLVRLLAAHPWGALGGLAALGLPFLYHLRVALGWAPRDPSLPMWIRAPGTSGRTCATACGRRRACSGVTIARRCSPSSATRRTGRHHPPGRRWPRP